MQLTLHEATLKYIGGVDPLLQWKAWGRRGSHVDADDETLRALKEASAQAQSRLATPEYQRRLGEFAAECKVLFDAFLERDEAAKRPYLDGREFYFVCGIMRSGGTYVFQEVSSCLGIDWRRLSFDMSHDTIPAYDLAWRFAQPDAYWRLLFDLCQFLVWAKRETTRQSVVQKRIAFAHAIPFLDGVFGERARYLITIRHPGAACTSFAEMEGIDEDSAAAPTPGLWNAIAERAAAQPLAWQCLDFRRKYLATWRAYYMDAARSGVATARTHALVYGDAFPRFVRRLAEERGTDFVPSKFSTRSRTYHPFWRSAEVEDVLSEVRDFWAAHGLALGALSEIA